MSVLRRFLLLPVVIVTLVLAGLPYPSPTPQLAAQSTANIPAALTVLNQASADGGAAPQLSAPELQAVRDRILQIRNRMAAQEPQVSNGPSGVPLNAGPQTVVSGRAVTGAPGLSLATPSLIGPENQLDFGRDSGDPFGSDTTAGGCGGPTDLAELVAVTNGVLAFAAGNCAHVEKSADGGISWDANGLPPGPTATPIICCDHDVIYDDSTRVVFHTSLYVSSDLSQSTVGIDVYRYMWSDNFPECTYFLGPTPGLQDFPHVGLTQNFLYLSMSSISETLQSAVMLRFPKTALANCVSPIPASGSISWSSTIEGQKVWRPSRGTNNKHTMFWAHRIDNSTLRIFKWDDASTGANNFTRPIAFSSSAAPGTDCAGGSNNTGYITATNTSLVGFNFVGAVTGDKLYFYWQAGPAAFPMTQAHIDGAVFGLQGTADVPFVYTNSPLAQPHIYSSAYCYGYPEVTSNTRGDLGMVLAFGGANSGGGEPVRPAAGVSDEFTRLGEFDLFVVPSANDPVTGAANNPALQDRYGDYSSTHPSEPCEKWFVGTGYFFNSTGAVNQRVFEYGRHKHARCYFDYWDAFGNNG
ncbi:MAG TPA: hypothetical protein VK881_16855 [bacterium]|nr:hypothetical protein [bacterium]